MGKQGQNRFRSSTMYDKTNPTFKWARMIHLLDYHRWHYVKKMSANKKSHEGSNVKDVGTQPEAISAQDTLKCTMKGTIEETQFQEQTTYSSLSTKSSSPSSSPRTKILPSLPSSPSSKSSRATRIKKMIVREVTKRTGRHRRSSTCPVNSGLEGTSSIHNPLEANNDRVDAAECVERSTHNMNISDKNCGLCSTMKIRCRLGDKKQADNEGEFSLDNVSLLLEENQDDSLEQLNFHKDIRRSASLQESRELLDIIDVMSMNKRFFLRILDDPEASLRHNFLNQQVVSSNTKRKSLTKSGTFPFNNLCSAKLNSFGLFRPNGKLNNKESSHKHSISEKSTPVHDNQGPRRRFKDLRQKIKHVIKESKKDRHIIAMDAVLHKVPYGQKVPEESTKDNPCVSTCEGESPDSSTDTRTYKKRSPSLDESLDKYCQLFETTSFGKEAKTEAHKTSSLRVMGDYSSKSDQKRLGRMFSSPDLQMFFSNQCDNYSGDDDSSRAINRRVMSFSEKKIQDVLDVDFEYRNRFNAYDKVISKNDLERQEDLNSTVDSMTIDNMEKNNECESNMVDDNNSIEVATYDNDGDTTTSQLALMPNKEPVIASILENEAHMHKETTLRGLESMQKEISCKPEEPLSGSPTFSCTKIDEDGAKTSFELVSPSLHRVRVDNDVIEEFNYVRDILQLSGYSGTEILGTWYSSEQPMDHSIFIELESCSLIEPKFSLSKEGVHSNHLLLFDIINEILLAIYERSVSYWCAPLSSCSRTHPMPKGYRVLDEVWACINWYMSCSKPNLDPSLDYITERDLAKDDKWMNLQFDAEYVGLEVEDLIYEDLLNEVTHPNFS